MVPLFHNERFFRAYLADLLTAGKYRHSVYHHEDYEPKFTMSNAKGYPDLFVKTDTDWPHHEKIKTIAIELKRATSLGWLIKAVDQVKKYSGDWIHAEYKINNIAMGTPDLFLVATPESIFEGNIYTWCHPALENTVRAIGQQYEYQVRNSTYTMLTELYERLLWKHGASVLKYDKTDPSGNGIVFINPEHPHPKYDFTELQKERRRMTL